MTTTTTTTGIACANRIHKDRAEGFRIAPRTQHHHADVATVKACFATPNGIYSLEEDAAYEDYAAEENARAEAEAEAHAEVAHARMLERRSEEHIERYGW